mgnify:CR=1 FL=1
MLQKNLSVVTYGCMFSVGTIVIGGVKLKFWDLGGQEELQSLWDKVLLDFPSNFDIIIYFSTAVSKNVL